MIEHVTYGAIRDAYFDCRRHKVHSPDAIVYAREYEMQNLALMNELNDGTYRIGRARRFGIAVPTCREVYAYQFRDRVVEHLIAMRILPILEDYFIEDSYSCRKGKGVLYGVRRVSEQTRLLGKECLYAELDISAYFPNMLREVIWDIIAPVIRGGWNHEDDVEWWLQLLRVFIFHDPSVDCIECGNIDVLERIPREKCLGHDKGEPIGNLLNQIFAIVYLTPIDKWLTTELDGYGRYVDDMILLSTSRGKLLRLLPELRKRLAAIGMKLNEKKTVIQRADKGIRFTGYIIKPWGLYPGKRLRRNVMKASITNEDLGRHVRRLNSYLGFLCHTMSYGLRYEIWNNTLALYGGRSLLYAASRINSIHIIKNKQEWLTK